jgi:molybdopterin-guanine dinucleotide biosynthesis protein A
MPGPDYTVLVLAGGRGQRVGGRDKGLLAWHGVPLIEQALRIAATWGGRVVISANRHQDAYARYGVPVWSDAGAPFRGPLSAIATALAKIGTPWLCTLPVDAPSAPPALAVRLRDAALAASAESAVAHDGERRQPLFAIYARALAEAARRAADGDERAVWRFQRRHGAVEVACAEGPAAFANVNTAADLG